MRWALLCLAIHAVAGSALAAEKVLTIRIAGNDEPPADTASDAVGADADARTGTTFEDLYKQGEIRDAILSPTSSFVAYVSDNIIMAGNSELGYHEIFDFGSLRLVRLRWSGDNVLIGSFRGKTAGTPSLHAMEIGIVDGEFGEVRHEYHAISGYVHNLLHESPEYIEFALYNKDAGYTAVNIFRINVFRQIFPQTKSRKRLNKGASQFVNFLEDSDGEYVVGVSRPEGPPQIWVKRDKRSSWEHIWSAPEDAFFVPVRLSPDGRYFWALSNVTTDRIAAIEFDLDSASIRKVLYQHDRFDLDDIIIASDEKIPVAASHNEAGLNKYHFFSGNSQATFSRVQALFPDQSVILTDFSDDDQVQLVYVTSAQNPGEVHLCNPGTGGCELVGATRPWLSDVRLAETIGLQVASTDGLTIEAFLTLPVNPGESIPLLAMPHGGPIGVADNKYYSGDVQWLALNGYAVLQVNYRGSGGYGKSFESSGLREWGRGIEDDVEASISHALTVVPALDADRVGIVGSSYGGYSALMSVIENPELFKCAASFAGVTDLTLLFNQSSARKNEGLRDQLVEMIGDPNVDYDELLEYSPVYQYKRIGRPVFIAHGNNDPVVDVEHSWRLRTMLNLAGANPEFLIFEKLGHGFPYVSQAQSFYDPLIEFLDECLKPDATDPPGSQ